MIDLAVWDSPIAYIYLRACCVPCPLQCPHHGFSQSQNEDMESLGIRDNLTTTSVSNDPSRFGFTHQTSFVKRHVGLLSAIGIRWIVALFRQFFGSVTKVDYLTMRHGFINAHLSPNSNFNFHKYIKRSLEDDFKVVVGISPPLWVVAIIILVLDTNGYYSLASVSFVPLVVLVTVGIKLELVIMEMAQEIQNRNNIIIRAPVVEPNNKYFWFNKPQWVLFLIHLTLFENAFQMAHFLWTLYSFNLKSCFYEKVWLTLLKVGFDCSCNCFGKSGYYSISVEAHEGHDEASYGEASGGAAQGTNRYNGPAVCAGGLETNKSIIPKILNMVEKVASFKGGGAFWFTDLATPDPQCLLPMLTVINSAKMELNILGRMKGKRMANFIKNFSKALGLMTITAYLKLDIQEEMDGDHMANIMRNTFRALALLTIPFTSLFPKAFFFYWITTNLFSLFCGFCV